MILISLSVIYKTFLNTRRTDKHATFPLMQKVLIFWTKASISWPVLHIQAPGGKHRNHGPHCWDTPSTTCTDSSGLQDGTRQPQWTASLRRREDTSGQAPISKCLASSLESAHPSDAGWILQKMTKCYLTATTFSSPCRPPKAAAGSGFPAKHCHSRIVQVYP